MLWWLVVSCLSMLLSGITPVLSRVWDMLSICYWVIVSKLVYILTTLLSLIFIWVLIATRWDWMLNFWLAVWCSLRSLYRLRLWARLNDSSWNSGGTGDICGKACFSHFLVHVRQLAWNVPHTAPFVCLGLHVSLAVLLLLKPFLWAALHEFVSWIIILDIIVNTAMLSSRLNSCFRTVIPKFLLPIVKIGVISHRYYWILINATHPTIMVCFLLIF